MVFAVLNMGWAWAGAQPGHGVRGGRGGRGAEAADSPAHTLVPLSDMANHEFCDLGLANKTCSILLGRSTTTHAELKHLQDN